MRKHKINIEENEEREIIRKTEKEREYVYYQKLSMTREIRNTI